MADPQPTPTPPEPTAPEVDEPEAKPTGKWYAHTDLVWSNEGEERQHVEVGGDVDVSKMDDNVFDTFVEAGAIQRVPRVDIESEEDVAQIIADKDQRIAELEAALAAAKKK